jgi:hypothetical protein
MLARTFLSAFSAIYVALNLRAVRASLFALAIPIFFSDVHH